MSHQVIQADLIVDLSTDEQEILTGGNYSSSKEKENGFNGGEFNGSSSSDDDESPNKDGKSKYNFLVYRPTIYNPKYYIKA